MSSQVSLLRSQVGSSSAVAKFVLLKVVQLSRRNKPDGLARFTLNSLVSELGISRSLTANAVKQLVESKVFAGSPLRSIRGRPVVEYRLVADALADPSMGLAKEGVNDSVGLEEQVSHLLNYSCAVGGMRLSYSDRVLLAVLLAHSDQLGVVRGLGLKDIANFSGLAKPVLRHRLDVLVARQCIRAIIPGVTGGIFSKVPSVYVLNLTCPCFELRSGLFSIVVNGPLNRDAHEYPAYQLLMPALRAPHSKLSRSKLFDKYGPAGDALELLYQSQPKRFEPILQELIDRHASYFLSRAGSDECTFEELGCDIWKEIKKSVIAELRGEQSAEASLKNHKKREECADKYAFDRAQAERYDRLRQMALLIFNEVRSWALDLRRALADVPFPIDGVSRYYILPRSVVAVRGHSYVAVLALTEAAEHRVGCYLHGPESSSFLNENEIPAEDRQVYGLLTKPKRRVKISNG